MITTLHIARDPLQKNAIKIKGSIKEKKETQLNVFINNIIKKNKKGILCKKTRFNVYS